MDRIYIYELMKNYVYAYEELSQYVTYEIVSAIAFIENVFLWKLMQVLCYIGWLRCGTVTIILEDCF